MKYKKEFREDRCRIKKELCEQLWGLRLGKGISLQEASIKSGLPSFMVESLEFNGLFHAHLTDLQRLANIYNRHIRILLVSKDELSCKKNSTAPSAVSD